MFNLLSIVFLGLELPELSSSRNVEFIFLAFPIYFFFFLIFAFKTYASLKRFLLNGQNNVYIILSSYVEGYVKKIKSESYVFGLFLGVQSLEVVVGKFTV